MEVSELECVTAQYNWKGEIIAYIAGNTTVPTGNENFNKISTRVSTSSLIICEPSLTSAIKVYGEGQVLTGYRTNLGFVPNNTHNKLMKLLDDAMLSGEVEAKEPEQHNPATQLKSIIMCKILSRAWDVLPTQEEHTFAFRRGEGRSISVIARLKNLKSTSPSAISALGYALMDGDEVLNENFPIMCGAIELEWDIKDLSKIYSSERSGLDDSTQSMLNDLLEQNLVATGRSKRRGPSLDWLIENAHSFSKRLFVDTANNVIRKLTEEFGGIPPEHVTERSLSRTAIVFARQTDGTVRLNQFFSSRTLMPQPDRILSPNLTPANTQREFDFWQITNRIGRLVAAGFAHEALAVANAYLEKLVKQTLSAIPLSEKCKSYVTGKGHRERLDLIDKIAGSMGETDRQADRIKAFVKTAQCIYKVRNDYVHDLIVIGQDPNKFSDIDRAASDLLAFALNQPDPAHRLMQGGLLSALDLNVASAVIDTEARTVTSPFLRKVMSWWLRRK